MSFGGGGSSPAPAPPPLPEMPPPPPNPPMFGAQAAGTAQVRQKFNLGTAYAGTILGGQQQTPSTGLKTLLGA